MSIMKITSSGQVSVPADIRRRWDVHRLRLIDHGDHITLEPVPDDVVGRSIGMFRGRSPLTGDEMRDADRRADEPREKARAGTRRRTARQPAAG